MTFLQIFGIPTAVVLAVLLGGLPFDRNFPQDLAAAFGYRRTRRAFDIFAWRSAALCVGIVAALVLIASLLDSGQSYDVVGIKPTGAHLWIAFKLALCPVAGLGAWLIAKELGDSAKT